MGKRVQIELSEKELETLKTWANSGKTEQRLAIRVKIILFDTEGMSAPLQTRHFQITDRYCYSFIIEIVPLRIPLNSISESSSLRVIPFPICNVINGRPSPL